MCDRADRPHRVRCLLSAVRERIRRYRPSELSLFSGVYGLVLASAMAAALDTEGQVADPGPDALWVLLTALASATAHGYAHVIARRTSADGTAARGGPRSVLAEWPLVAAVLPTVVMLLAASAAWWTETVAVDVVLVLNTLALTAWGTWAARTAGRSWPAACRAGGADLLIGLLIIAANAVLK